MQRYSGVVWKGWKSYKEWLQNEANNAYTLIIEYVADNNLTKVFNRVCDSFENYSKGYSEE